MKLVVGERYDLSTLHLIGWSGDDTNGYSLIHYFSKDGIYKGADSYGVEPIVIID